MASPAETRAGSSRGGRRQQEMKVLAASGIPFICAFAWSVHLSREAARPPLDLDLSKAQVHVGLKGFSAREPWGRWTEGEEAAVVLAAPLPPRFDLTLDGWGYGPNAGAPVEVRAGDAAATLVLRTSAGSQTLSFRGATGQSLVFRIPHPSSPRELGAGNDRRRLGIAVSRLAIRVPGGQE